MTRRDNAISAVLAAFIVAGVVLASIRITWDAMPSLTASSASHGLVMLAGLWVGVGVGRNKQRRADTWGFWKSRKR